MATIRELQAQFIAKASGMKSTIQGVKKDINQLASDTKKASGNMNRNFSKASTGIQGILHKTSDALGRFSVGMKNASKKVENTGRFLISKITKPAAIATTAVAGLVGALGFKRLVGLDSAQAKLKGLGYSAEDVERISKQVETAIEGGMTTMGEGVDIAAGGLAAGVKEGKELERYIRLVGDAAIGSNRPVGEMAQIFNRVQGQGKLMTQELNMIEQGLPGFAQAMADEVAGGSLEAFRDMVTNGEVGSKEFLDVMDDFAGGMASAYSESWAGMAKNALAYIGIIGESMLEGAFEEGKKSLAEFIELLKSDEVQAWAKRAGEVIRNIFTEIVDKVKSGVEWFKNLSKSQQEMIMKLGAVAVAAGPVLTGLGLLGGAISKVASGLSVFFGWLAPLIKPLKSVGKVAATGGKSVGLLGRAFSLLGGPIGIAIGIITTLVSIFTLAYKKSETFRNFIQDLGGTIKDIFGKIMEWVQPGIDAVIDFFGEMKDKIMSFKNEEGAQLTEAFQNIGKVIGAVAKFLMDYGAKQFENFVKIIEFVMPFAEEIIKQVWSGIKSIISGALDVILGAVRVFSGLFTGDWSKMWEGVKQIGSGLIEIIWGFIKASFFGRIITGLIDFVVNFVKSISDMWTKVKNAFVQKGIEIYNNFKNSFIGRLIISIVEYAIEFTQAVAKMWNEVKAKFKQKIIEVYNNFKNSFVGRLLLKIIAFSKDFRSNIGKMWNLVKEKFKQKIIEIYNNVKNSFVGRIITKIIDFAKRFRDRISDMWSKVRKLFTDRINSIRKSIEDSFVGKMLKSVRDLKTKFVDLAKDMWKGVKDQFNNIVDGAKGLPKRIGDGIKNAKDKATAGMKEVGNAVIRWAGKPFNKVVDGVNWITGKLDVKTKVPTWDYPQYAKGTKGHPEDGPAIVGDKYGRELVQLPNGRTFLSPDTDTLVNLPKGTHVIPNKITEKVLNGDIPYYAKGTLGNIVSGIKNVGKNLVGKVGKTAGKSFKKVEDIWGYASDPKKLVKKVIGDIGIASGLAQIPKKIAGSGLDYLKKKPADFIKEKFDDMMSSAPGGGAGVQKWAGVATNALRMTNQYTKANLDKLLFQMKTESGGNPKAINLWDINAQRGTPSKGLMQVIDPTFAAYKMPGFNDIWAPLDNILASIRYAVSRYGSLASAYRGVGYADGGIVDSKQLAWIAEGGWAESIISHDPSKRVRQQRIWRETGDKLGFTYDRESDKPTEITQNLTINSPKHLTPSEISRKNLQSLRRMALEMGF